MVQRSSARTSAHVPGGTKLQPWPFLVPGPSLALEPLDPLGRNVYGIMGIPIDAVSLDVTIDRLKKAADEKRAFVLSTPNLNFLVLSQSDWNFRESLLTSDLCPADGMPIVWLGRLLGVPLHRRIAGSDIFDAIKLDGSAERPMKVFLFGGANGLAKAVADKINASDGSMTCVGAICPGFGTAEQLSAPELIREINASGADFIAAFLGAQKGQDWLVRNHEILSVPIRSHLGATINYQAGTVQRAPTFLRKWGLEWLWRIKEEPYLWRRYLGDGMAFLRILSTSVLPLMAYGVIRGRIPSHGLRVALSSWEENGQTIVSIEGDAVAETIDKIVPQFRIALAKKRSVLIDLTNATLVDARLFGALLMLRKSLKQKGLTLRLICKKRVMRWIIKRHGFSYLLADAH